MLFGIGEKSEKFVEIRGILVDGFENATRNREFIFRLVSH